MNPSEPTPDVLPDEEEISQAYRRARFDEEPPHTVDQMILAEAGRRRGRTRTTFTGWLPPMAIAATVLLSFSLVLRLGFVDSSSEDAGLATFEADALEEEVVDRPDDEPRAAPFSLESSPPAGVGGAPSAPNQPAEAPLPTARASSTVESSSPQSLSVEAPEARALEAAPLSLELPPGQASCEAARSEARVWLDCIATLVAEGATGIAGVELADFRASYPDYPVEVDILEVP